MTPAQGSTRSDPRRRSGHSMLGRVDAALVCCGVREKGRAMRPLRDPSVFYR